MPLNAPQAPLPEAARESTTCTAHGPRPAAHIDRRRYRRIRWFFTRLILQTIWWDVFFRFPVLAWFRPSPRPRWQAAARRYRHLATEMGGVLIKLGQFLSTRVDLFPPEVTQELADLQDEVPAAPLDEILGVVADDFGCPLGACFQSFAPQALGAASLAQAHEAVLPDGQSVIVKVLRPRIHDLVETDLNAMRQICRALKLFQAVRLRMDLDLLLEEFARATRCELDLIQEKHNLQRFAADFRDDPGVHIPRVYEAFCRARVLTLENVAYVKIGDIETLRTWGIDPRQVAARLYDVYMRQVFTTNFVHVDPHPGNLFVKPLPTDAEAQQQISAFLPGQPAAHAVNRAFQLVFIDFGMTAEVSPRIKAAMRMAAIGLSTQDTRKVIQAYIVAGALRPGTDLRRLEEAHQEWLQKVWGLKLGKIQETAFREMRYFLREYRDLMLGTPFQLQADMLLIGRALGILAGLATRIDPEFDPWQCTLPYAKRFAREELTGDWEGLWQEIFMLARHMWRIPAELDQVLTRAKQGALTIQVSLSPETRRAIRRIDQSVKRFAWMVLTVGLLVSGVNLHIADKNPPMGLILVGLAVVALLWGLRGE